MPAAACCSCTVSVEHDAWLRGVPSSGVDDASSAVLSSLAGGGGGG